MKLKQDNYSRTILGVAAALIGTALLGFFLMQIQSRFTLERQRSNSHQVLNLAKDRMAQNAADFEADWSIYDDFSIAMLKTIAYTIDDMGVEKPDLATFATHWEIDTLYLCDAQGNVIDAYNGSAKSLQEAKLTYLLEGGIYDAEGDLCFFRTDLADGRMLVGGRNAAQLFAEQDARLTADHALGDIKLGTDGYVAAIDLKDGTVSYAKDSGLVGKSAESLGLNPHAEDGGEGWLTLDGSKWHALYLKANEDTLLVALSNYDEMLNADSGSVKLVTAIFAFVVLLIILYRIFILSDIANGKLPDNASAAGKLHRDPKMRCVLAIGVIAIFALGWYTQTLEAISRQRISSADDLLAVSSILDENDERIKNLTSRYEKEYTLLASGIAWTLSYDPNLMNDTGLSAIANCTQVPRISVFDPQGQVQFTSDPKDKEFVLTNNPESRSYPFWDVIKGYESSLLLEMRPEDLADDYTQYVGVQRLDGRGMVQLGLVPSILEERLRTSQLSHVLDSIVVENDGMIFAADAESGNFLSYPEEGHVNQSARDHGLTDAAFTDNYTGYQTIDGSSYLLSSSRHGDELLYVAVPTGTTRTNNLLMALFAAGVSLVLLVLVFVIYAFDQPSQEGDAPQHHGRGAHYFENKRADGSRQMTQSSESRWSGIGVKWSSLLADQKLKKVMGILLTVAAVAFFAYVSISSEVYNRDSVLSFILSKRWEHGFNIFSVSYVLIVLLEVGVVSMVVRRGIMVLCRNLSSRGETIGRLLDSFIKYVSMLGALFYGLYFFCFDAGTLLASAGIVSVVVGLGANALIGDIFAGIFIVFEGEFRVGDIISIGGWTGTVQEIGIRTTKVKNLSDNVRIFRNASISEVTNMTKQYSFASVDVGIEYDESLERVEAILKDELPRMRENLPGVVDGPFYRGVASLGDSAVIIKIVAQCREADRVALERAMMREIKLMFDHHDIGIPFPQVVVNQPSTGMQATPLQKHTATKFVAEQEMLTKDLPEDED